MIVKFIERQAPSLALHLLVGKLKGTAEKAVDAMKDALISNGPRAAGPRSNIALRPLGTSGHLYELPTFLFIPVQYMTAIRSQPSYLASNSRHRSFVTPEVNGTFSSKRRRLLISPTKRLKCEIHGLY